jgi:hypothetical protein
VDVPEWDLALMPPRRNSHRTMQIDPTSPNPLEPLWSGRRHPPASSSGGAERVVRVLIGDGDDSFRHALRASFANDPRFDVIGEADDGDLALHLIRWLRPDVALVDEDMPSFGGAAIARVLRAEVPETRVVVLTRPFSSARP